MHFNDILDNYCFKNTIKIHIIKVKFISHGKTIRKETSKHT